MENQSGKDFFASTQTFGELLHQAADRYGDVPFLVDGSGKALSRTELDGEATRFANAILAMGLEPGSTVGIFSPNSINYVIACYGVLRSGLTLTPLNSSYRRRELLHQVRDSGAAVVFAHPRLLPRLQECAGDLPDTRFIELDRKVWAAADITDPQPKIDPAGDVAFLPYSSGTTGLSKGVELTHRNLITGIRQILAVTSAAGPESAAYCFLPMYHIYGFNVVLNSTLASGSRLHVRERFDVEDCIDTVERERVTWLPVVPPVILALLARPDIDVRDLSSLGTLSVGAAPVALPAVDRLRKATGVSIRQGWGMTETAGTGSTNAIECSWDPAETAGVAVEGFEFRIVDGETGERELATNEVGELTVRGDNIMLGYHSAPEENRQVLRDGWFYTGDIARVDEQGRLHIEDRKRQMIKYKGFQVTPAELESVILELPEVRDCAVLGKKDPEAGEIPKAYVVAGAGVALTEQRIFDYVAGQVAGYKKVREVEFVESIPRSAAGKILKQQLAQGSQ